MATDVLDQYLQTEQAREDVREMLAQPSLSLGELVPDSEARIGSVRTDPLAVTWSDYKHKTCAWRQVELDHSDGCLSVYYRPDGDRFVVTDLGEGVRALRLRTGSSHRDAVIVADGARNQTDEMEPRIGDIWVSTRGIVEIDGVKLEHLPDAICRVMLASLRVAQS